MGLLMPSGLNVQGEGVTPAGGYAEAVRSLYLPSRYVQSLPVSPDPDPFGGLSIYLAERAMAYFRAGDDPRPYSVEAAFYPVQDHLHRIALEVTGRNYCELEQRVGRFVWDAWRFNVPFLLLRSFCLSQLRNHLDPMAVIQNQTRVRDVSAYLMDACQRGGVCVLSPKTPRPVTVTEHPWPPDVPDYDAVFDEPNLLTVSDRLLALEWPDLDADEAIDHLRRTLRAKKRIKKVKKKASDDD